MCISERERVEGDYNALSVPINTLDTIYEGTVKEWKVRAQARKRED